MSVLLSLDVILADFAKQDQRVLSVPNRDQIDKNLLPVLNVEFLLLLNQLKHLLHIQFELLCVQGYDDIAEVLGTLDQVMLHVQQAQLMKDDREHCDGFPNVQRRTLVTELTNEILQVIKLSECCHLRYRILEKQKPLDEYFDVFGFQRLLVQSQFVQQPEEGEDVPLLVDPVVGVGHCESHVLVVVLMTIELCYYLDKLSRRTSGCPLPQ